MPVSVTSRPGVCTVRSHTVDLSCSRPKSWVCDAGRLWCRPGARRLTRRGPRIDAVTYVYAGRVARLESPSIRFRPVARVGASRRGCSRANEVTLLLTRANDTGYRSKCGQVASKGSWPLSKDRAAAPPHGPLNLNLAR